MSRGMTWLAPLTGREARLLLDHLDNIKAASTLDDHHYNEFFRAKLKLVDIEVAAEYAADEPRGLEA